MLSFKYIYTYLLLLKNSLKYTGMYLSAADLSLSGGMLHCNDWSNKKLDTCTITTGCIYHCTITTGCIYHFLQWNLGLSWPWSYGSWIYNYYLCNQCLSPLMLQVRISIRARCTTLCDKVCQWLATGRWFSLGPLVSSTNKTDRHDITEILLKVALNTIKQTTEQYNGIP